MIQEVDDSPPRNIEEQDQDLALYHNQFQFNSPTNENQPQISIQKHLDSQMIVPSQVMVDTQDAEIMTDMGMARIEKLEAMLK
jgi:hypothetical protein